MLLLQVLGSWRAEYEERPIPRLPTRHARALLTRLAMAYPRALKRTQLYHDMFPGMPSERATHNLRTTLYYVRRALPTLVQANDDFIGLEPSLVVDLDVCHFERGSASGASQAMLERAIAYYRGPFLEVSTERAGWVHEEAERLRRQYVDALQRLIALSQASGHYQATAATARRWLDAEPWNEEAVLTSLEAFIAAGDRRHAQALLKTARALVDESGLDAARMRLDRLSRTFTQLRLPPSTPPPSSEPPQITVDFSQSALLGRAKEWNQLKRMWEATCASTPQTMTIQGETGSGKTRLVNELVTFVRSCPSAIILTGQCNPYVRVQALGVLRTAFTFIASEYQQPLHAAANAISDAAWHVLACYPEFRALAPDRPTEPVVRLDSASEIGRRKSAMLELLTAIVQSHALLLVLDDACPSDQETDDIIQTLASVPRRAFVIHTCRVDDCNLHTPVLSLSPLCREPMRALVASAFDDPISTTAVDRIVGWSEGNPLRAREIMRALISAGRLWRDTNGRWTIATGDTEAPDLQHAVIYQQPGHISPSAQELVQLLAILGRPCDQQTLACLLPDTYQSAQHELVSHRIVIQQAHTLQFEHSLLRDTILKTLDDPSKQALHARIAKMLRSTQCANPTELMLHALGARDWQHAWVAALAAAEQAWTDYQLGAMQQALHIADQASAKLGTTPDDVEWWNLLTLREQYAAASERGVKWTQAIQAMQQFATEHHRADWRVEALVRNGRALREQGRLPEAEPLLFAAADEAQRAGLAAAEARARTSLAAVLEDRGAVRNAVREQQAAVDAARRSEDVELHVHTLGVLAYMQMRAGNLVAALNLNTALLDAPIVHSHPVLQARFARHQGIMRIADRHYQDGLEWLRRSIGRSQEIGDLFGLLTGQTSLVYYQSLLGQHSECLALGNVLVPQVHKDQANTHLCWLQYALARASYAQGDAATATLLAHEAAALGETVGDFDGAAVSYALAAAVALDEQGDSKAVAFVEHALRCMAHVDHPTTIVAHIAARVWLAIGDDVRARASANRAIEHARAPGLASVYTIEVLFDAAHVLSHIDSPTAGNTVRDEAYRLLVADLARIQSPPLRRAYLNASRAHHALAASRGSGAQRIAILPLNTAPRGRSLHDDEFIPAVWTVKDAGEPSSRDQRRLLIQRLVGEAAAQGAVSTIEALAIALAVAPRTIQRDLQALRQQGIAVDTRGTPS